MANEKKKCVGGTTRAEIKKVNDEPKCGCVVTQRFFENESGRRYPLDISLVNDCDFIVIKHKDDEKCLCISNNVNVAVEKLKRLVDIIESKIEIEKKKGKKK